MEENLPTKGVRPITGMVMYNFLYWLLRYHYELTSLQTLPVEDLLSLAQQFEEARPDLEPGTPRTWRESFEKLFSTQNIQDDYTEVRNFIYR